VTIVGTLLIYARHANDDSKPLTPKVPSLNDSEVALRVSSLPPYKAFGEKVKQTKRNILQFLIQAKDKGKSIAEYGAPGKGNTLLNYCGIHTDFIDYTVDRNPYKQGKYTPGTRIPIHEPERIKATKPDYVFILPWNLKD